MVATSRAFSLKIKFSDIQPWIQELKALDKAFGPAMRKMNYEFAKPLAATARGIARSMPSHRGHSGRSVHAKAAGAISPYATQTIAGIQVRKSAAYPMAFIGTFGSDRFSGWNVRVQGKGQHPKWVGNSWKSGGPGGPYALNDAIRMHADEIEPRYLTMLTELVKASFPD